MLTKRKGSAFVRAGSLHKWLMAGAALTTFIAAGGGDTALAQSASQPTDNPSAGDNAIEEVVVTVRRRAEALQDVPVAATVLNGDAVLDTVGGQINPSALFANVPGLRVNDTGSPGTTEVSMRGSGTARATSADSGVALYRDGAFVGGGLIFGRTFLSIDLFDLQRAEVLRGTQAALYGRNAVGGAINLVSAKPSFDNSGRLYFDYNDTVDRYATQLVQNYAIDDNWAVRFSGEYDNQDGGFYYNSNFHNYLDGGTGYMVRGQIRYKSTDGKFDGDLLIESQDEDLPGIMTQVTLPPGTAGFPAGYKSPKYRYAWNIPGDPAMYVRATDVMLSLSYDLGWATWSSESSVRHRKGFSGNYNATQAPGFDQNVDQYAIDKSNIYFEEMQLTGESEGLTWLVGADYLRVPTRESVELTQTPNATTAGRKIFTNQTWTSAALFGSLDYNINDEWEVSAEGRYTMDHKKLSTETYRLKPDYTLNPPPSGVYDGRTSPNNFSYNAILSYKPQEGTLAYAKVGTGYRVGGFNTGLGDPRQPKPIPPTFGNELTTAYEAGLKQTMSPWFSGTLAVYYNKVSGALTQDNNGCAIGNPVCPVQGTNFVTNAGNAYNFGVELQGDVTAPVFGGQFNLNITSAYQEGKFTSGAYKDITVPQTPKWEFSFIGRYDHTITSDISGFGSLEFTGQWDGIQDVTSYGGLYEPLATKHVLNFRAGIDIGNAELAIYGDNITDDEYFDFITPQSVRWGPRQSWGVQARYRW